MQIGNGGATGSVAGDILDNAALAFSRSDTITYSNVISGSGSLTQLGAGTLILTNDNSYTGGTTISVGTLQIGNSGATGSVTGDIVDNANLAFDRSDSITYANVISGTGSVTKLGAGTLTLTGENTYTGGTTITAGILQIGSGGTAGSVSGNILDNASLVFNRSDDITFDGVISGSGTVTKIGAGTLILTGDNNYTGGTTITAGTLQIGKEVGTGSVVGNILNDAALVFKRRNDLTYAGAITGSGTVTKLGEGILTLTGANAYTGGTTVSNGMLQIGNGGTAGSVAGDILDNAEVVFDRSDNITYSNVISGSGSVMKLGAGTLVITNDNTYTGGTIVNAGTLQLGGGGTTGSVPGNILDNASLAFNHSDAITFANVISGDGSVTKLGSATLILTGANTYAGGTTISAGTLQIGNGGTDGSIAGPIIDNASLIFDRSDDITYADPISGAGSVTKLGAGTMTIGASNTYSGGSTLSAGTLQIGSGGVIGSVAGNILNNTAIIFNRSDDLTYEGAISGPGSFTKLGGGTLTLTGANSYTGGTTISEGALQIGNGGTTGNVSGDITNNTSLIFNRSDSITYANVISGTGAVTKLGRWHSDPHQHQHVHRRHDHFPRQPANRQRHSRRQRGRRYHGQFGALLQSQRQLHLRQYHYRRRQHRPDRHRHIDSHQR